MVVGFASGEIPRIPLNLVLLKGVIVTGFEFGGFVTNAPDVFGAASRSCDALLASGALQPHVSARYSLDDVPAALRAMRGPRSRREDRGVPQRRSEPDEGR